MKLAPWARPELEPKLATCSFEKLFHGFPSVSFVRSAKISKKRKGFKTNEIAVKR